MNKFFQIAVVVAVIAGAPLFGPAIAEDRGDPGDRGAITANQMVAQTDARTARVKADLRLTPDQEKNWPGFESAMHTIGMKQADRMIAFRAERGQQKQQADVIEHLNRQANVLGGRAADVKSLADAAKPLYASLAEPQKRRFASELIRLSSE